MKVKDVFWQQTVVFNSKILWEKECLCVLERLDSVMTQLQYWNEGQIGWEGIEYKNSTPKYTSLL